MKLSRVLVSTTLSLLLAACAARPRPPLPAPDIAINLPPAPPAPTMLNATWNFKSDVTCNANAVAVKLLLQINASSTRILTIVRLLSKQNFEVRSLPIQFASTSGKWVINSRVTGHKTAISAKTIDEYQVSRLVLLLSGGVVRFGEEDMGIPSLRIPNAGQAGQAWLNCVQKLLLP